MTKSNIGCASHPWDRQRSSSKSSRLELSRKAGVPSFDAIEGWSFSCPFSTFYFLVGRWLSGRSLPAGQAGQRRRELAGGEGVEGAEAGGGFGIGQAALGVEGAEGISGRGM